MSQVFVGGYCGSGTRVIQMILEKAGFFIGDLNGVQYDYIPLASIKANLIMDMKIHHNITHKECLEKMFASWWGKYDKWSIKHGFLMLAIPVLRRVYPKAKIVVMVRHPIDNILNEHNMEEDIGRFAFPSCLDHDNLLIRRAKFWNYCYSKYLREADDGCLLIKLEDLVNKPKEEIKRLFDFLEVKADIDKCAEIVHKPQSIGRRFQNVYLNEQKYAYFPEDLEELKLHVAYLLKTLNYEI